MILTRRTIPTLLTLAGATLWAPRAGAAELELRVLVISTGDAAHDPGRALMERVLLQLGVPYDVLDSSQQDLTRDLLYLSESRGRYNGVILTESQTWLDIARTGFDAAEFALLHEYERTFGVREAVLSGFPAQNPALGLDYGMATVSGGSDLEGLWTGSAGGTDVFEYVRTDQTLPISGFAFAARPREDGTGPAVEPLLVDDQSPGDALISRLSYPDGREVLLCTAGNAPFFLHSSVLAYEFLNFATSGLFIGARHVYLSIHNDDLFLADALWNPSTRSNYPLSERSYRWSAEEVPVVVAAQQRFRQEHPLAADLTLELAFNAFGADAETDPLTQAVIAHADQFGFVNHTYHAWQMDHLCTGEALDENCVPTDFQTAFEEIDRNALAWAELGLPHPERAYVAVLTDSHSGIEDRRGTRDRADDIPFPDGFNPALGEAAEALGVRLLASDASRENQNVIQRVPYHQLVLLPRYPTAVFYNTTTPEELVSEYNYLFHERFLDEGRDPCTIPGALCAPRTYDEILDAEAVLTLRHMLAFEPYPHYFHQSNLHVYDGAGRTLQFDWLEHVLEAYASLMTLPIESPLFHELADVAWDHVRARELSPSGVLDTSTGTVTLRANSDVRIEVTGVAGGRLYGGQSIRSVRVSPAGTRLRVDPALDR